MSSEDDEDNSKHTHRSQGTEHDDINSMDGCSFTYSPKPSIPNPPFVTEESMQGDFSIPSINAVVESPISRRRSKRESRKPSSSTQTRNEALIQNLRPPLLESDESNHNSTSSEIIPEEEFEAHQLRHVIVSTPMTMSPANVSSESMSVARSKGSVRAVDPPAASRTRSMSLNPYTAPRRDLVSPLSKAKHSSISRTILEKNVSPLSKKPSMVVLRDERKIETKTPSEAIASPRQQKKKHLSESVSTDNIQVMTSSSRRKASTSPRPRKRSTVISGAPEPSVKDRSNASPRSGRKTATSGAAHGTEPNHAKLTRASSHVTHHHHGAERSHDVPRSEQDMPSAMDPPTSNSINDPSLSRRVQSLDPFSGKRRSTKTMENSPSSRSKNRMSTTQKEKGCDDDDDDESSRSLLGRVSSSPSSEGSEPPRGESRHISVIQNGITSEEFMNEAKSSRRKASLNSMLDRKSRSKSPRPRTSKVGSLPMAERERRSRSQSPRKSKRQPKSHRHPEKLSKVQIKQQQRHRVTPVFFPYTRRFDDDDDASEGHFSTNSPKVRQSKRALGSSATCSLDQQRQSVLNAFEKVLAHDQSPFSPIPLAKSSDMFGSQLYDFSRRDSRTIVTLEKTSVTIS